nr:putative reverse transcriptase domain-containing protein [Tanacetum cinerariifolium]
MANPNPKNPNVPNEGVPEEDPHHLLDYDEEEDPEMDIEEEEPEEDPVEEPEPLAGHGDQFDAHPNPQPGNMNGWVDDDDDDDVEEEDGENEDVDIEEDDDAEIIFPYEAEEADDELKVEEPDGVPEATIGTGSQRPFAIRDFPIGFYEAGESSTTRDPQFVGGLAPWALRRDLEAGAGGSGGDSGSGGAGGSGGTGGNADGTGVRGTRPTVPKLTGCTYTTFIKCDPLPFNETKGAVCLCQWFKKLESVFQISECKEKDRVKFDMATLRGRALTWWNERMKAIGIEAANNTPWSKVKKWMTEEFCPRSVIQRMEQELY